MEKFLGRYFGDVTEAVQWHRLLIWVAVAAIVDLSGRTYGASVIEIAGRLSVASVFFNLDGIFASLSLAELTEAGFLTLLSLYGYRKITSKFLERIWRRLSVQNRVRSAYVEIRNRAITPSSIAVENAKSELVSRTKAVRRIQAIGEFLFVVGVALLLYSAASLDVVSAVLLLIAGLGCFCKAVLAYLSKVVPSRISYAVLSGDATQLTGLDTL